MVLGKMVTVGPMKGRAVLLSGEKMKQQQKFWPQLLLGFASYGIAWLEGVDPVSPHEHIGWLWANPFRYLSIRFSVLHRKDNDL